MRLINQSFVTTPPRPGGGLWRAGQKSRFFTFTLSPKCNLFFELLPFAKFGIENLLSRYLKNYYSKKLQTWSTDRR